MTRYDELLALINACGVAPGLGPIGQNYQMEQNPRELAHFIVACEEHGVTSMLELGAGEYGGLARLCYTHLHWSVTSIDHRAPLHESGRFILGETSDEAVYAQVKDNRYDLVFIDADHNYSSVISDHRMYAALAMKVVAFHDIAPGREGCFGVVQFWRDNAYPNITDKPVFRGGGDRPGMTFPKWGELREDCHEAIDTNHPIGIGWYEV